MQVGIEMEHFPEFKDDIAFMNQLIIEQAVMCVPGTVSNIRWYYCYV